MGDDNDGGAVKRAQQPGQTAREVMTGDDIESRTSAFEIEILPGPKVNSVRVRLPGMDWFVTGADQLRDWLREHRLVPTARQWDEVERKLAEALRESGALVPSEPSGAYEPGDGLAHPTPGAAHDNREALDFLRQALARLAAAGTSETVADEIRGVYLQANHLVMGPKVWEPAQRRRRHGHEGPPGTRGEGVLRARAAEVPGLPVPLADGMGRAGQRTGVGRSARSRCRPALNLWRRPTPPRSRSGDSEAVTGVPPTNCHSAALRGVSMACGCIGCRRGLLDACWIG